MALSEQTQQSRSQETRAALIRAGLRLFGEKGFEATSTRELAAVAGTNAASIAYHFGNKHGLRTACGMWIVETISAVLTPALAGNGEPIDQAVAEARIVYAVKAMAGVMTRPMAEDFAPFLLREISHGGDVFEAVYANLFLPMHTHVCTLWAVATGADKSESEDVRLEVFAAIGQLVYFRIGRLPILRRMGWDAMGPNETARIADLCADNVRAQIAAARKRNSERSQP